MEPTFAAVATEIKGAIGNVTQLVQQQHEEIKVNGETTAKTAAELDKTVKTVAQLMADLKAIQETSGSIVELKNRLDEVERKAAERAQQVETAGPETKAAIYSKIAKTFTEQFKSEMEKISSIGTRGAMAGMGTLQKDFPGLGFASSPTGFKAVFSQPELVQAQRLAGVLSFMDPDIHIADLIPTRRLNGNSISWLRTTVFNAAGGSNTIVRTGGADTVADTVAKPETKYAAEEITLNVKTIAHWIRLSMQTLRDNGVVTRQIETDLLRALDNLKDYQLLYGGGTGADLAGITSYSGEIQSFTWSTDGVYGDTKIDALRKAMTLAKRAHYRPNLILTTPEDWQDIQLAKGTDGHYLLAPVSSNGINATSFFAVRVLDHTAVANDSAIVGDFQNAATIWQREGQSLRMFEQDEDNVQTNTVTVRAEEALLLQVSRPDAFVAVSFDSAPPEPT